MPEWELKALRLGFEDISGLRQVRAANPGPFPEMLSPIKANQSAHHEHHRGLLVLQTPERVFNISFRALSTTFTRDPQQEPTDPPS